MAKFDPSKTGVNSLVYSTLLGMTLNDFAYAVAVDSSGDVYVVGRTTSTDFPTTAGAFQPAASSGGEDAFLAKLSPGGLGAADLLYSTYIGGSGQFNEALAVAALSGSTSVAFVAGITNSTGLATSGAPQTQLDNTSTPPTCGTSPNTYTCVDAFMMKFDLSKTGSAQKSYSTYIGGRGDDIATSIAVDTSGNAFVAGYTNSANLPTAQPVQATSAGGYDAFITRLDASGARNYATYLGGSDTDVANGIAVDSTSGNVFVAGYTYSTNFLVTPGAMQSANGGIPDVFVAKLGPGATGVVLLSPSTLTFNGEGVGNTSSALTITLRNIGGSSVTGVAVTPTGANPSDYTASATGCATLAGGSSCTISVTFKPGAVGASSASLSISYTGASGSPQTVTLAGTGQDFDFVSQTASQTVTAGGTAAQYTLTVTPQGGFHFDNAVAFSCTGLPTGAACSAPSVTPGATAKNSTLGISTTRRSLAPPMSHRGPLAPGTPEWFGNPWLAAALLLTLLLAAVAGTRQRRAGLVLATGLLVLLTWTACGGGGGTTPPPPTGTPVGTYTITVNAKSGSLTHTASVTLVVQ
ncbi:MAG: SBBP repeat-containing protein [Acidobacteriia bacterium]|nr:SBBP repeat-containing protein [Terriglobia bacterium]